MKRINNSEMMDDLFQDTEPYKIYKKEAPVTSREAAYTAPTGRMRSFVLDLIEQAAEKGVTIREMNISNPQFSTSSISSRPNELEKLGAIFYRGDKRNGSRVIRHIKYKERATNETH